MLTFGQLLDKYYTEEDAQKLGAFTVETKKLRKNFKKEHGKEFQDFITSYYSGGETVLVEGWKKDYFTEQERINREAEAVRKAVIERYKADKTTAEILEDVRRIAESYTKEEFQEHIKLVRNMLDFERFHIKLEAPYIEDGKPFKHYLEATSEENYKNCFGWLYGVNSEIEEVLDGEALSEAVEIFKARVDTFGYERPATGVLSWRDQTTEPELPELPKVDFNYPVNIQQNLTKASSTLFNHKTSIEDLKQISLDVTPNKKGITTTYSVNVDLSAPELKGTENITEFDKSVHNIAVSIALTNKDHCFTAKQVATVLYYGNNPTKANPSKQQIGAVTKSIEKQSLIKVSVDWTQHYQLNNKGKLPEEADGYKSKNYVLPVKSHIFIINGAELEGYQLLDTPPLYAYAVSVGQLGQHPVNMLNLPINLDQTKIVLRDFLLEEIAHIKNNKGWNKTISVDKLLIIAGEDSQTITKKKRAKLLEVIEKMLIYWKKEEYIKDYTLNRAETKRGKPLQSYTIEA